MKIKEVIKLGSKVRDPSTTKFVSYMDSITKDNPVGPNTRVMDVPGGFALVNYEIVRDFVVLDDLHVPEKMRRAGIATEVMRQICQAADKFGTVLKLSPVNYMNIEGLNLKSFYSKFGFEDDTPEGWQGDAMWTRYPKVEEITLGTIPKGWKPPTWVEYDPVSIDNNMEADPDLLLGQPQKRKVPDEI